MCEQSNKLYHHPMNVYRSIEEFHKDAPIIMTQGFFDGVHLGHQMLLQRVVDLAKQSHGESLVITYWPHPRVVLGDSVHSTRLLSTLEEKIELIEKCGVDHLLIIPFTKEFSQMTSIDFIHDVLVKRLGISKFVIGYDHTFGKDRMGTYEELVRESEKYGFEVEQFGRKELDDVVLSSGLIRSAVMEGKVKEAAKYLGRCYSIRGTLTCTSRANTFDVQVDDPIKLIPANGEYEIRTELGDETNQVLHIIGDREKPCLEVDICFINKDTICDQIEISIVDSYLKR